MAATTAVPRNEPDDEKQHDRGDRCVDDKRYGADAEMKV